MSYSRSSSSPPSSPSSGSPFSRRIAYRLARAAGLPPFRRFTDEALALLSTGISASKARSLLQERASLLPRVSGR